MENNEVEGMQKVQIDLAEKLMQLCKENGIPVFMVYGTLLGAVRHKGFIPWDDDMDFAIWRKDVGKLKVAAASLPSPYRFVFTDDPYDFCCNVIKFQNIDTTYVDFNCFCVNAAYGISIDVEIIDETYANPILRTLKNNLLDLAYETLFRKEFGAEFFIIKGISKMRRRIVSAIAQKYTRQQLLDYLEQIHIRRGRLNRYCSIYTYKQHHALLKAWFDNTKVMKFDKIRLDAPVKYRECLKVFYGNKYMFLPAEADRIPKHSSFRYIDLEISYRTTIQRVWEFARVPEDKTLILWGAGNMSSHYLNHFGKMRKPDFIVDNNPKLWGNTKEGILIISPERLYDFQIDKIHLIICNIYYKEIIRQLKCMGKYNFFIYLEEYVNEHLHEGIGEKVWNI